MKPYPENVSTAIVNTAEWLGAQEDWVVRGQTQPLGDRLQAVLERAFVDGGGKLGATTRRDILLVLSYLPAKTRLGFLFAMAERQPDALEALLADAYDRRLEPVYYNILATIGSFARHALLADIFSSERLKRAEMIVRSGRALTGIRPGDENIKEKQSGDTDNV